MDKQIERNRKTAKIRIERKRREADNPQNRDKLETKQGEKSNKNPFKASLLVLLTKAEKEHGNDNYQLSLHSRVTKDEDDTKKAIKKNIEEEENKRKTGLGY